MKGISMRRASRSGVAALAVAGLVSSLGAVALLAAPSANAVGTINDVVINEVESNGDATNGDWIELYNNNPTDSVSLNGAVLTDNDNSHVVTISGTIAPHGYATFQTDASGPQGDFGLGGADAARLYASAAAVGGTPVSSYTWATHASTTYGRFPNGTGPFVTTTASTHNGPNSYAGSVNPSPAALLNKIKINEVESSGDAVNGNWIELTNVTGAAIDVSGAILSDNNNGHIFTIPASTTIPAGGYKAFVVQDAAEVGAFGLGDVDSARLFVAGTVDLATATPVDSFSWNTHSPKTYGRVPNGSGAFTNTAAATFGTANGSAATPPSLAGNVVINEVESNNDSTNGDWVELYNKSGVSQVIAGAAISDADNTHVFGIPATTPALAPGAYRAFRVDDPAVDGSFGLGNVESARLFNAGTINIATATPVDSYSWTSHATTTYGRIPNGTGAFTTTSAGTFGSANN
ncbi:lamin tail domain-containing protein [Nocardioides sp. LHG3406-4]|uniref:lamin tail domain-containing protein n=1 Tax=Nocardioides sp. LHG3406-4 TaxID=2804575 RepID=UPI003CEDFE2B